MKKFNILEIVFLEFKFIFQICQVNLEDFESYYSLTTGVKRMQKEKGQNCIVLIHCRSKNGRLWRLVLVKRHECLISIDILPTYFFGTCRLFT